jgi:hypothetical protein
MGRCTAEQQKPGWRLRPVDEHAEDRKELRHPLYLIDNDEAAERFKREEGIPQRCLVGRVLEVEETGRSSGSDLAGEGRLAALPRPKKRDRRGPLQPV